MLLPSCVSCIRYPAHADGADSPTTIAVPMLAISLMNVMKSPLGVGDVLPARSQRLPAKRGKHRLVP
jgi:hypothetical protein